MHPQPMCRVPRLASVPSAHAVEPAVQAGLCALRVLQLDEVMTSGASVSAAAQVLRHAGAAHVTWLVFARTDTPSFS